MSDGHKNPREERPSSQSVSLPWREAVTVDSGEKLRPLWALKPRSPCTPPDSFSPRWASKGHTDGASGVRAHQHNPIKGQFYLGESVPTSCYPAGVNSVQDSIGYVWEEILMITFMRWSTDCHYISLRAACHLPVVVWSFVLTSPIKQTVCYSF